MQPHQKQATDEDKTWTQSRLFFRRPLAFSFALSLHLSWVDTHQKRCGQEAQHGAARVVLGAEFHLVMKGLPRIFHIAFQNI